MRTAERPLGAGWRGRRGRVRVCVAGRCVGERFYAGPFPLPPPPAREEKRTTTILIRGLPPPSDPAGVQQQRPSTLILTSDDGVGDGARRGAARWVDDAVASRTWHGGAGCGCDGARAGAAHRDDGGHYGCLCLCLCVCRRACEKRERRAARARVAEEREKKGMEPACFFFALFNRDLPNSTN